MSGGDDGIKAKIKKAFAEGRLVSCLVPGGGDLAMSFERHMIDDAIAAWETDGAEGLADQRRHAILSVKRAIKHAVKRIKNGKATQAESDALAADVALWLGYELLYADGERHIIKNPDPAKWARTH